MEFIASIAAIDDLSCITCLEEDGIPRKSTPKLPHKTQEGCVCRCVLITLLSQEENTNDTRASSIGQIPIDGGVYKAYLLKKAQAKQKGMDGQELANYLKDLLPELESSYPEQQNSIYAIKASILYHQTDEPMLSEVIDILKSKQWNLYNRKKLFEIAFSQEKEEVVNTFILCNKEKATAHGLRHGADLYRDAAEAIKKISISKAIGYYENALKIELDNTSIYMALGKLYRRGKKIDKAIKMFQKVLKIKNNHKGAETELKKCIKK